MLVQSNGLCCTESWERLLLLSSTCSCPSSSPYISVISHDAHDRSCDAEQGSARLAEGSCVGSTCRKDMQQTSLVHAGQGGDRSPQRPGPMRHAARRRGPGEPQLLFSKGSAGWGSGLPLAVSLRVFQPRMTLISCSDTPGCITSDTLN